MKTRIDTSCTGIPLEALEYIVLQLVEQLGYEVMCDEEHVSDLKYGFSVEKIKDNKGEI